ncbi:MAG: hypothetical protein SOU27_10660 [Sodaliphilus sp.]|nr:hypothetical protein [Sodaliphilus sp.]
MLKHIVQYSIIGVLAGLLLWGIFWARGKAGDEMCTQVEVDIPNAGSITFVTRDGILNELRNRNVHLVGEPMRNINTDKVEAALHDSEYLENVDCYKAQNGKVVISATQLVPVLRVFDGGASYYVNARGKRMSATASYHADVPIVEGHFTKDFTPMRILPLVDYVNSDQVLRSLVSMYCIKDTNDIFVVPIIKGHVVNLGNADNYVNKFKKLLLFYRKVMPVKGWLTYDTVSVKWEHQVVATKRVRAVAQEDAYDASLDEPMADIQTMSVGDVNQTLAVKKDDKPGEAKKAAADDELQAPKKKPVEEKADKKADEPKKKSEPATKTDKKEKSAADNGKKKDTGNVKKETAKKADAKKSADTKQKPKADAKKQKDEKSGKGAKDKTTTKKK